MIPEFFRVMMFCDIDYEDMVAEIYYEDKFVAMISQEEGLENAIIEIFPPQDAPHWCFKLNDFNAVLAHAKQRLWDLRKLED